MSKRISRRRPVKVSKMARLLNTLLEANLVDSISGSRGSVRITLVSDIVLKGREASQVRRIQVRMEAMQEMEAAARRNARR